MDTLEFLKEQKRMCKAYKTCNYCPLSNNHCIFNHLASDDDNKKIVNFVEQWSKEHPRKTRQIDSISKLPAADVAPVRHGRWIYDHWCEFKCSVCGEFSNSKPYRGKENYCPNCGARMDGGAAWNANCI